MLCIRVRTPTDPEITHEAPEPGPVRFGRALENDLVLDSTYISRSHGEFRFAAGDWWVEAWGSRTAIELQRAGTREELPERTAVMLRHGDVLQLLHTRLEIQLADRACATLPTPTEAESVADATEIRPSGPAAVGGASLAAAEVSSQTYDALLWQTSEGAAASLLEFLGVRFPAIAEHSLRTGHHSMSLAAAARRDADSAFLRALRLAGWLHDIGKLALSAGSATSETQPNPQVPKLHPELGATAVSRLMRPEALHELPRWILEHHERLNGSGYPAGLRADRLAFPVRVLQVADVFDAASAQVRDERDRNEGKRVRDRPVTPRAARGWARCCSRRDLEGLDHEAGCQVLDAQSKAGRLDPELVALWIERELWRAECALHAPGDCPSGD